MNKNIIINNNGIVSPEHFIRMKDGSLKKAKNLKINDTILDANGNEVKIIKLSIDENE